VLQNAKKNMLKNFVLKKSTEIHCLILVTHFSSKKPAAAQKPQEPKTAMKKPEAKQDAKKTHMQRTFPNILTQQIFTVW